MTPLAATVPRLVSTPSPWRTETRRHGKKGRFHLEPEPAKMFLRRKSLAGTHRFIQIRKTCKYPQTSQKPQMCRIMFWGFAFGFSIRFSQIKTSTRRPSAREPLTPPWLPQEAPLQMVEAVWALVCGNEERQQSMAVSKTGLWGI